MFDIEHKFTDLKEIMQAIKRILFVGTLLCVSLAASAFMVLEAGQFYQGLYQSALFPFMGYLAAALNEAFMAVMAAVYIPGKSRSKGHPINHLFRGLLVLLFLSTVGGASFNAINDHLERLEAQAANQEVIEVLRGQIKDHEKSLETFVEQHQPVNSALTVRRQAETKAQLMEALAQQEQAAGLWTEVIFLVVLRFAVQMANLSCVWLAGWTWRRREETLWREALAEPPREKTPLQPPGLALAGLQATPLDALLEQGPLQPEEAAPETPTEETPSGPSEEEIAALATAQAEAERLAAQRQAEAAQRLAQERAEAEAREQAEAAAQAARRRAEEEAAAAQKQAEEEARRQDAERQAAEQARIEEAKRLEAKRRAAVRRQQAETKRLEAERQALQAQTERLQAERQALEQTTRQAHDQQTQTKAQPSAPTAKAPSAPRPAAEAPAPQKQPATEPRKPAKTLEFPKMRPAPVFEEEPFEEEAPDPAYTEELRREISGLIERRNAGVPLSAFANAIGESQQDLREIGNLRIQLAANQEQRLPEIREKLQRLYQEELALSM